MSRYVLSLLVAMLSSVSLLPCAAEAPDPESVFGFTPGADRQLIDYSQLTDYVSRAAAASPRVKVVEIGRSTQDRPMLAVFISSEANIARLDELKEINRNLALDATLSDEERADLIERGRVFVMATLSMHANEVAPAQALPLLIYRFATARDAETTGWLDDVVIMVVATLNPDGMDMMVQHYRASLDTPYEGGRMPGLYQYYAGHDNNRDFVALNLSESRAVSRAYSTEWFPQILIDKHQMGKTGPRYFVPRYHDPIAENIDGKLWNWSDVFGSGIAREMSESGQSGIASNWVFDEYWPGATTTSHWKNVISILTEGASSRLATPVYVEPNELRVRGKGLSEYKKSVNMPDPWPGGWWRLGDQVDYELASWRGAVKTASLLRSDILTFRNDICRDEVARGRNQPPYYYVVPAEQHDASERDRMISLLAEHGVRIAELGKDIVVDGTHFAAGDLVVSLAQPYRPFIKEVMESQHYPIRHYTPGGQVIRPYDITSWSLPLHMGVVAVEVETRSKALEAALSSWQPRAPASATSGAWGIALDVRDNASFKAAQLALAAGDEVFRTSAELAAGDASFDAGSFLIRGPTEEVLEAAAVSRWAALDTDPPTGARQVRQPRIAVVETWYHHMDAGWTRLIFDRYHIPYTRLRPGDLAETDLASRFDVVVFPDADPHVLKTGTYETVTEYQTNDYRPEYQQGLGETGFEHLVDFLEAGGRAVVWGRSAELLLEPMTFGEGDDAFEIALPVRDDTERVAEKGFYAPGTLVRMELLPDHPLSYGMSAETAVFTRGKPVLGTKLPSMITDRRVVGRFPERQILASGYAEKPEALAGRPALVWTRVGRGQVVFFGFEPQFRATTPATYKLLFNALLLPAIPADEAGVAGVKE